jgi:hypothetical protein
MKDPARTWNGTVVLRIMEKQRTADRLALCEQMDLEARVAEIAVVAALADRAHRSAIVVELARTLLNRSPASSAVREQRGSPCALIKQNRMSENARDPRQIRTP